MLNKIKNFLVAGLQKILKTNYGDLASKYPEYKIGYGTYGDLEIRQWGEGAKLEIGAYTSIASGVKVFLGGEHRIDWVTTYPFSVMWNIERAYPGHPKTKGNVVIGNDVWIGSEAVVLSGVTIGDGAVIGARAVVSSDVPPYAIFAGNPAKLIKYRFDQRTIVELRKAKWWDWSKEQISKAMPDLLSNNISHFLMNFKNDVYK